MKKIFAFLLISLFSAQANALFLITTQWRGNDKIFHQEYIDKDKLPEYLTFWSGNIGIIKNCGGGTGTITIELEPSDQVEELVVEAGVERGGYITPSRVVVSHTHAGVLHVNLQWCPDLYFTFRKPPL